MEEAKALGMENRKIHDDQITASSYFEEYPPSNARLNLIGIDGSNGGWSADVSDLNQWLQVDFQRSTIITAISTQGLQNGEEFVKKYTVSFSDDGNNFHDYNVRGVLKVR